MELIIDFDSIEDMSKRKFLLDALKLLNIKFRAIERPPTLVEFSHLLEDSRLYKKHEDLPDDVSGK